MTTTATAIDQATTPQATTPIRPTLAPPQLTTQREPIFERQSSRRNEGPKQRRAPLRSAIGRSLGKWLALGLVGAALFILGGALFSLLASRFNPFATKTIDRSGPVLLTAISDMHTYQAATGEFQVVVDIEKDAKWIPSAIRGERVVLLAQGSVDAGVDLGSIGPRSISIDTKSGAVSLTIPHAKLGGAHLDLQLSEIVRHDRGLFDRLGSTFGGAPQIDKKVFDLAETKLKNAAIRSQLVTRAEENTANMLRQLITALGHTQVIIHYSDAPVNPGPPAPTAN